MGQPTHKEADVFIFLVVSGVAAAFAAVFLGYFAHYEFGLSREQIRTPAVVCTALIAVLMAVEFFGKKLRKP